ncbi:MAG: WD40 repeat domain-containing protein [Candidatus Lokiarchaeia archaeon]
MKAKELWNFKYNAPILGIEVADINGNGQIEIIAYTKNGILLFISLNGKLLHKEIISKDSSLWHLKIYDINDDGRYELILGGMDGILRIFKCHLTYNLELLWTHKFNSSISGILIEDINGDNINELIIFSLDKTLRVLNPSDGKLVWGQVFENGVGDAIIFLSDKNPAKKEILACGNDGTIRIFNGKDGKLLWFKKYSGKIRTITYMNTPKGPVVICGGDDKKLHIINKITQNEIKTKEFIDYVWKCISYPFPILNNVLVSSYSFAYFDESIPIEEIEFTSNLICLNDSLKINWKLIGYNIEFIRIIKKRDKLYILTGTTKGELLIIEEQTGNIIFNRNYNSCVNMVHLFINKNLLFSCHDDGKIIAHKLEEISL